MQAYTYTIKHLPSNRLYYGVRKATFFDLGEKYFSSSKLVKRLLKEEPICNFEFKLRKTFNCFESAIIHEQKLLKKINAVKNPKMLNQAISAGKLNYFLKDEQLAAARKEKISKTMKIVWQNPGYKTNQKKYFTKDRMRNLAYLSHAKRKENYKLGINKRKPEQKKFKLIMIYKKEKEKQIKQNQTSAYKKCGWKTTKGV